MRVKFSLNHRQSGGTKFYLTNYLYLFDFMDIGCPIDTSLPLKTN